MTLTIELKEVPAIRKVCVLAMAKCNVYTWTAQVSQVEITELDGSELDPKSAWHIARMLDAEVQMQELKEANENL